MLRSLNQLEGYSLEATDGRIGAVEDFLFHENSWTVEYLVADTGGWLPGRKVVLPRRALRQPHWDDRLFPVEQSRDDVKNSPSVKDFKPVSQQHEEELITYYGPYGHISNIASAPQIIIPVLHIEPPAVQEASPQPPRLRSTDELMGYRVEGRDGELGHVDDVLTDDTDWFLRYLVLDTRNWLPGRKVLLATLWVEGISWSQQQLRLDVPRDKVRHSPGYNPGLPLTRDDETRLFDHYGRSAYAPQDKPH